ncbi:MAG: hypothetical protein U0232_20840 [Thermomicrobiales bacterium]
MKGTVRDQDGGEREYTATVTISDLPDATAIVAADAAGTYGGSATLTATLTADGQPLVGMTPRSMAARSAARPLTRRAAMLANVSLAGIAAGSYPVAVGVSFAGMTRRRQARIQRR